MSVSTTSQIKPAADDEITAERKAITEYEQQLQRDASSNIRDYNEIKILEQLADQQLIVVAETLLVERADKPMSRYALQIVELRNEATLRAMLHEIGILKKLELHPAIMGLFLAFRHRQYIGLLQPAFTILRDRIDLLHSFKKSNGATRILFRGPGQSKALARDFSEQRAEAFLRQRGLFNKDAVVYVLKGVISGLEYLGQKGFVHTQIGTATVFINEQCTVKLGSFLHCKQIGSKTWMFTGNPNRLPPEAFQEQEVLQNGKQKMRIKPNFDTWALGLLVLEMITGRRMLYTREEMAGMAKKFINGTECPPTLEETDPSTVVNKKHYYPNITDFIAKCLVPDHIVRKNPGELLNHPFMTQPINTDEAKVNIAVEPWKGIQWNSKRKLRHDMLTVHTHYAQLKEDLLKQICNAIHLVHDELCCPIFDGNVEKGILENRYIAVDVSLAFIKDEEHDWSQDVLDISNASNGADRAGTSFKTTMNKTPTTSGEQVQGPSKWSGQDRDYQHCEMVFFVKRNWSTENRRLFIALQFARWFARDLLSFADLVRVVDELEEILLDYMVSQEPRPLSPYKRPTRASPPDSIAFVTGLRRSLIDPESNYDPETHRYNNIFIEVALRQDLIKKKKTKMDHLREGDPVAYPKDIGILYASATYYTLNMERLRLIESVLLGERQIKEWEFYADERQADVEHSQTTMLTTLLKARRMNPNAQVSSEIDWETSNQARRLKLWGDYTRDFMFRFAKYSVPHQLDQATTRKLHGSPGPSSIAMVERLSSGNAGDDAAWNGTELDELQLQLARTKSKQEGDQLPLFKRHDDVEIRKNYAKMMDQNKQKDDRIHNLEQELERIRQEQRDVRQHGDQTQSPVPPRMEEINENLVRLPKHNQK